MVKNLSASLGDARDMDSNPGLKDPLEKEMATHFNILAWEIYMNRGAWRAIVHGVVKELDVTESTYSEAT